MSSSSEEEGELHKISNEEVQQLQGNLDAAEEGAEELIRFYLTKSSHGKYILRRDGFKFAFEAMSRISECWEYWKCPKYSTYCPGRIHVFSTWHQNGEEKFKLRKYSNQNHSHLPKPDTVK
jgi:hypothetical protein